MSLPIPYKVDPQDLANDFLRYIFLHGPQATPFETMGFYAAAGYKFIGKGNPPLDLFTRASSVGFRVTSDNWIERAHEVYFLGALCHLGELGHQDDCERLLPLIAKQQTAMQAATQQRGGHTTIKTGELCEALGLPDVPTWLDALLQDPNQPTAVTASQPNNER